MINIDDLVGVRYRVNGRDPKFGFNCYGLAIEVSKRFGHELPDLEETKEKDYDFLLCQALCLEKINVIPVKKPTKESDIILFEDVNGVMFHIGIYLGNNKYIHCDKQGVHLSDINQGYKIGAVYQWQ